VWKNEGEPSGMRPAIVRLFMDGNTVEWQQA
jgi:hypothetical protein